MYFILCVLTGALPIHARVGAGQGGMHFVVYLCKVENVYYAALLILFVLLRYVRFILIKRLFRATMTSLCIVLLLKPFEDNIA